MAGLSVLAWPPDLDNRFVALLSRWETFGYDAQFLVRGARPDGVDPRITVIGYDTTTVQTLGSSFPPPRRVHAQVIRNLKKAGAKLIVYDVLFAGGQSVEDDKALDAALKEAGNVVLTCRVDRDNARLQKSIESPHYDDQLGVDFESASTIGFAEISQDGDNIVRTLSPVQRHLGEWVPSLAAAAYLRLNGLDEKAIRVTPDAVYLGQKRIPSTAPSAFDPVVAHSEFALAKAGKQTNAQAQFLSQVPNSYLNFPGGNIFPMDVQFQQVYAGDGHFDPSLVKDKIVFVGVTGVDLTKNINEQYATAFTSLRPESSGSVTYSEIPGVVVQAHMLNAILKDRILYSVPRPLVFAIVFVFSIASLQLVRKLDNRRGALSLLVILIGYLAISSLVFNKLGWILPWVIPTFLILATSSLIAWLERGAMRKKWSGYVSPAVFETILQGEGDIPAKRYEATVMFGDVRGFTTFSDLHSPEKVVRLLNEHFERMTEIIYREQGTIDKFMGDGILVAFGAPVPIQTPELRAVRAALEMRDAAMAPIIDDGEEHVLATGFGVTSGGFVAGHVGSRQRHDFTMIGDVVNVAARLQGVTGEPDVIIDQATYDAVREQVVVEPLGEVQLKGKPQPVPCYKVLSLR